MLAEYVYNIYRLPSDAIRLGFVREFKRIVYADLSVNVISVYILFFVQVCKASRMSAAAVTLLIATKTHDNSTRETYSTQSESIVGASIAPNWNFHTKNVF